MQSIAGIAAAEAIIDVASLVIRLRRVPDLAPFVDAEALLSLGDPPEPPYWTYLWPAAMAVARRVAESASLGPGVRVLELGCGLGLPSLVAAARGAAVVATDWERDPLRFARVSAVDNAVTLGVVQMDWRAVAVRRRFDLCLGADIAYDRVGAGPLAQAVVGVLRPGGTAWLADSVNIHSDELMGTLEKAGCTVNAVTVLEYEEGRPVWVRLIEAHAP